MHGVNLGRQEYLESFSVFIYVAVVRWIPSTMPPKNYERLVSASHGSRPQLVPQT
jgi:hypothetical protein